MPRVHEYTVLQPLNSNGKGSSNLLPCNFWSSINVPNTNQSAEATACHLRLGVCLEGNANHIFKNFEFYFI
jgi:hypothetical protein